MSKIDAREHQPAMEAGRGARYDSFATGTAVAESQPFRAVISGDEPPDLATALEEMNSLAVDAREDGYPVPSNGLLASAESMLRRIYGHVPLPYMVSSANAGEVIIYACPKFHHSIALTLFADGEALCSAFVPDERFSVSRASPSELTDGMLQQAAAVLKRALG